MTEKTTIILIAHLFVLCVLWIYKNNHYYSLILKSCAFFLSLSSLWYNPDQNNKQFIANNESTKILIIYMEMKLYQSKKKRTCLIYIFFCYNFATFHTHHRIRFFLFLATILCRLWMIIREYFFLFRILHITVANTMSI